ncbi:hypothetical protein GMDG_02981 [Pseudogymnoascus destructans 20631-21]|uniref:Uncharacterized protein n=2 Tax=Pseudogymnoascus destructans TaxID=655981 RepID=L8G5S1_PSED2|nr:hypothetical protein GMDG_02981 [Pseudogymnoascus destructans 20631-21]
MLQAEIAAATGTARSIWWDAHSDATQATVKNLKLQWKFSAKYPQFPNGDSYDQVSMLPRTHQLWTAGETQTCIKALQRGDLFAAAWEPDLASEHHSDESSSAYKSASSISSRNGAENDGSNYRSRSDTPAAVESPAKCHRDLITPKHYQRVMDRLRTLLKNTTGYSFPAKQNGHLLYDNPSGKGAYKWCFSDKFRRFPQNAPSKWTTAHCRLVEEALDRNWLSVTPLPGTRNSDSPVPMPEHTPTRPPRATTTPQRPSPNQPTPSISAAPNPNNEQPKNPIPALLTTLNRDLTSAYNRTLTTLTTTLLASTTTHHTFLSSSLSRLSSALASQRSTDHSSEIATMKQQIAATQSDDAREAELAQARAEGDVAGQQRAIKEIGDIQDGLLRSHLQELMRVRREARMEGYGAGFRAGVEQGAEQGRVQGESGLMEERLGELFEDGEDGNLESEVGVQGGLGVGRWREAALSGENRKTVAEMGGRQMGGGGYISESEFQLQPHPGVVGGRRLDSSELKHPLDYDGELYNATPPRATKVLKIEHPDNSMGIVEDVQAPTENRLILHKGPSEGLAQPFSGGLFLSSDEEIDEGMRDAFGKDGELGFSYF